MSLTMLLLFRWRYLSGSPNAGSKKGFGWTIFGLSDTDFYQVAVLCVNWSLTLARWELSKNVRHGVVAPLEATRRKNMSFLWVFYRHHLSEVRSTDVTASSYRLRFCHTPLPLILIVLSRLPRGIQSVTEMLPLKRGGRGVANSCNCPPPAFARYESCWHTCFTYLLTIFVNEELSCW